jgi:hypothetical protein
VVRIVNRVLHRDATDCLCTNGRYFRGTFPPKVKRAANRRPLSALDVPYLLMCGLCPGFFLEATFLAFATFTSKVNGVVFGGKH